MAKGKAKLRVISGGRAKRAVVAKPAPPKPVPATGSVPIGKRAAEPEPAEEESFDEPEPAVPPKRELPRVVVFAAVALAIAAAMYFFTRKPQRAVAPPPAVSAPP